MINFHCQVIQIVRQSCNSKKNSPFLFLNMALTRPLARTYPSRWILGQEC